MRVNSNRLCALIYYYAHVKPIDNMRDNSTSVDPFSAHAKILAPPLADLKITKEHKKQQTKLGTKHPTMTNFSTTHGAISPIKHTTDALHHSPTTRPASVTVRIGG